MKTALDYTVDDLKDIIVRAWESGLCRGKPPAPYVMEELERVYRESIKYDKPWGFGEPIKETVEKLRTLRDNLMRLEETEYYIEDLVKKFDRVDE